MLLAMQREKEPLYRRVNSRTHGLMHGGGEYRWSRHKRGEDQFTRGGMKSIRRNGLDYTPLFRFLLSRLGGDWADILSEAVARLDTPEPISWVVAASREEGKPYVRIGENSYFSGMFVDEDNRLRLVDPGLKNEHLTPNCPCCTHTFNGTPFVRRHPGWT